jgi:protein-disulfide isomerase
MLPVLAAVLALTATASLAAAPATPPAPASDAMSLGNPKAKVVVEEFASASCTHCAHFNNEVFPAFKKKYIDSGKVRYTLKEFLTPPENVAAAGFLVARCSPPDKYFPVLDAFFHSQDEMYEKRDLKTPLMAAGKVGGLDEAAVQACLQDKPKIAALTARLQEAQARGINATPTFFFNGEKVKEGAMTMDEIDKAYVAALKPRPKAKK